MTEADPRLDGHTQTRPLGALPRRGMEPPVSGAAITERVPEGWALEAAMSIETGARPGTSAGVIGAAAG